MASQSLTRFILLGLVAGILTGLATRHLTTDTASLTAFAGHLSLLTDIFLRLIKMIIAPLVFSTLVVGMARMPGGGAVGRIGGKTLLWFVCASLLSLTLGLIMVNLLQPGQGLAPPDASGAAAGALHTQALTLRDFVLHAVPKSVVEAMADNEILQIVVFSLFFGGAMASLGPRAKALLDSLDVLSHVMLKVTTYVMVCAPIAVFAAVAAVVTREGLGVLAVYGRFMAQFYLSIGVLWLTLTVIGGLFIGRRVLHLLAMMREPLLLAFSTASSEAAYPKTLEQLERFGCSSRIASFVLPMGYSFNLDGSMMYCTFAVVFIAQAYGIELSLGQEITMLLILMLTSKGMAGIPRASLVVIAATLNQFGIPEAGLLLLLGVDHFLDMGRSATNVVGNSIAAAVVARWEGELSHHHGH
ncbi:MAG: dicarboxylate/amino acid:cation symporter [Proteobacteria bacterium]|nr:dicarboxylate/amino acid:cation symporter [Pseudomonadota bacterium]HQR03348.1 dicarboxylate/amino acid:cation symporter [Rhodocyclaceae bacterium]